MNKKKCSRKMVGASKNFKQLNPDAAGIDLGSKEHYVAVPIGRCEKPVRAFGCFTPDLHKMARWLKGLDIKTIAMESTGVYWVPVMQVLEQYGFDVKLVDARQTKNVPGRKSDVKDCQWIQRLHSFGLLSPAFVPEKEIRTLRSYWRHRDELVKSAARQINLMQKALEQMNVQLHKVLSDISGQSGMRIIRSIIEGEHNPHTLAALAHSSVKQSKAKIASALTGDYHKEHLFSLTQAVEIYDIYQDKLTGCDNMIESHLSDLKSQADPARLKPRSSAKRRKNQVHFDLRSHLFRITGVDLTQINGIDAMTANTVISECGFDVRAFPTEKHFASWLAVSPNHQITGGKVKKRGTRKVKNKAADALRVAAMTLHSSKSALGAFYRRMRARLGAPKAITATAHKLARIIYNMLKYGHDYVDKGQAYYEERYKERVIKSLKRRANELGIQLVSVDTGEIVS